jgi:tetratricopeptide (TPR) repeat protein
LSKGGAIKRGSFSLEKEALLASGLREKSWLDIYVDKLDQLHRQFIRETKPTVDPIIRARTLFTWLWIEKPTRYKSHGSYRLSDVIDAQLSKDSPNVGNCLGLTLLYNCLLKRMDIEPGALYLENAFGIAPHILTLLPAGGSVIDIENILPDGFDYKGHQNNPMRERWGDRELVGDIYHSLGNDFFEKGEWNEALKNFEMAICLNPRYEKAHLNKTILLESRKQG